MSAAYPSPMTPRQPIPPNPIPDRLRKQGAFKRVAAEVEVCAKELGALLRKRLLAAPDQAAECIQMIAKLGEPTEALQVCPAPGWVASGWVGCRGAVVGAAQTRRAAVGSRVAARLACTCLLIADALSHPPTHSPISCPVKQEDFLECKRQRLEGMLAAAGLMLKTLAVDQGLLPPSGG